MLRILRFLRESLFYVIIIILLLCLQAVTDLKLPKYTSDIVNIGIQQSGIKEKTPNVIRKKTMDELLVLTMSDAEILSNYELMERTEENIKNYPLLKDEDIYLKNDLSQDKEEALCFFRGNGIKRNNCNSATGTGTDNIEFIFRSAYKYI